ncbi:MAG: choice-of-anchor D domain-containing protein [Candidatus Kapabacteria bacterium]|nr:choice-of-anchor D domain-containing protein [Candidatus Kapabacteria bacterium]
MKRYILILSLFIITSLNSVFGQVAVISEYFNRTATPEGEWTEILITGENVNLIGCTLRDNSESGDWQGGVRFKDIPLWQNLRKGTIIVVWHRATGAIKDINPADGYLEVNAEDDNLFEKRLFSAPTWGVAVLNIGQNIDIIQLLDASDNNIHSLGHSNIGETSAMSSITNYRIFHNGAISGDTYGIRVLPGRNIDEYNKGWDESNQHTEQSTNTSKGLPNTNALYPNENRIFWQSLRQPKWNSYKMGVSVKVVGSNTQIEWTPANSTMDPVEGYLILRVPTKNITSTADPIDGKIYNTGDMIGTAKVVGVIYYLNQNHFFDNDFKNAECGQSYIYRVYAFRFGKDDHNMDIVPENERGRIYNISQFALTDSVDKPNTPKPVIKSKDDRNDFCETEDVYIDLIGNYTADLTFQWYCNGAPIQGETGAHLNVYQSGLYQIIAKNINTQCETPSDIIKITILPKPTAELFIKRNDSLFPVLRDTIIYVCRDNNRLYPHLIIQGADSIEWYFDNRLKTEEINKFETIADQRGTYYGVVMNGICRDSTPSITILYYDVKLVFDKTELNFIVGSKPCDTLLITNKSNADLYLNKSDFTLPSGIEIVNITFPIIIRKDSSIKIEFQFTTINKTYFYRVEKIFISTVCSRSFDISATMINPEPQTLMIIPLPDTLDFGVFATCEFEQHNTMPIILKSIGNLQAKVTSIEFPMSNIKINANLPFIIDSNSDYDIYIEILDATPKALYGEIRIIYESIEATPKVDTVFIHYRGEIVVPDLIFDNNLNFAIPTCTDTAYFTTMLTNPTNLEIRIDSQPSYSQLVIEDIPVILSPYETKSVKFRLISNTSINFDDKIIVQPCNVEKEIKITASKSNITINTKYIRFDFGDVAICDDSINIRDLTLQVTGGEVKVEDIDISGDFLINAKVGDIYFGDTTLKLKYIGSKLGLNTGKLKLTFSPCDMVVELDLVANAIQPDISINPENYLDFGDVLQGTISTRTIMIKNITNLKLTINLPITSTKFTLDNNIQLPIVLKANEGKEIIFNYYNPKPNEYDTLVFYINILPCNLSVPYKFIAHSIENDYIRVIKIDLPEKIEGKPGDWVNIPVHFSPHQFSLSDIDISNIKIDFDYNGKILFCKGITSLNNDIENNAIIKAAETSPNLFRVSIDSIPHPNPSSVDWMNFNITAQILQGDTLQDIFKIKDAIIKSQQLIEIEEDSSTINITGDCLIESRRIVVGSQSKAGIMLLPNQTIYTKIHLAVNTDLALQIYDINGILIKEKLYNSLKYGNYDIYTDISDLMDGIYFVKITSVDLIQVEKIIYLK